MRRNYYLFSPGNLRRKDNTLVFQPSVDVGNQAETTGEEAELLAGSDAEIAHGEYGQKRVIPVDDVDSMYVFSEMTFNTRFFNWLSQKRIPLHMFNWHGFYTGSWYPKEYLNSGFLLVHQVQYYQRKPRRLALARAIIDAASFNMAKNLKYYNSRGVGAADALQRIETYREQLTAVSEIDELMGVEGNIRQAYYSAFPQILKDKFDFEKRVKNPPDNAVNALISFGNAMVYTACLSEIYRTQLSPLISFLHEPGQRRFSLALDLAEIFKPLFADRIIFRLLNQNMISHGDFDRHLNYCHLKPKGRKVFVQAFEEKMKSTFKHRTIKRHVSYRRLIRLECYKLIKHITGAEDYKGFRAWW